MSNDHMKSIPYAQPWMPQETSDFLAKVFASGQISGSGMEIQKLEIELARLLNSPSVLAVSNGSAAIRMGFQILDIKPGTKVILPGWGFHVAANIAHSMGASIEFRDVNIESWCLETEILQDITETKENVIVVLIHTLGNSSNLTDIGGLVTNEAISILEDAAQSFLSLNDSRQLGTIFDIGTFSMHAAKTITTGEGGFMSINKPNLIEKAKLIRNHGMSKENPYTHIYPGDNYRISNLLAALAIPQLKAIEFITVERSRVYQRYKQNLSDYSKIHFLKEVSPVGFFPWGVCIRIVGSDSIFQSKLRDHLRQNGVDSRPGFTSAENLPYFSKAGNLKSGRLNNSNLLAQETVLLPQYVELSNGQIDYICNLLVDFIQR